MTQNRSPVRIYHGHVGSEMGVTVGMININVGTFLCMHSQDKIPVLIHCFPVIVFDNGRSGFLGEHSCMDGTPTLRTNEFIIAALAANKVNLGPSTPSTSLSAPKEVTFETNDAVLSDVRTAEKHFDELVGAHDIEVLHYEGYGKSHIKKFKASPDAWAQLIKQLAFYKLAGRPGVTYESTQTRKFQLGRTEVLLSASIESKAWVDAMNDHNATARLPSFRFPFASTYLCFCRMNIVRTCSAALCLGTYNMLRGQQMDRASTVICLV